MNANRLADELDVSYKSVRHHLDMLVDHDVVEPGGEDYGQLYFTTDRFEHHHDTSTEILATTETNSTDESRWLRSNAGGPNSGGVD